MLCNVSFILESLGEESEISGNEEENTHGHQSCKLMLVYMFNCGLFYFGIRRDKW